MLSDSDNSARTLKKVWLGETTLLLYIFIGIVRYNRIVLLAI